MSTSLVTGVGRAPLRERRDDLYQTPDVATEALLAAERFPHHIWEPACGPGAIVRVLRRHGHRVTATDLVDYGLEDSGARIDFLMEKNCPPGAAAILTNPPYKLARQFVEHALRLCPRVIMLLRLGFLESESRSSILDCGRLARVMVFKNRLPMMHRDGWQGKTGGSAMAFAWYIWKADHRGPTEISRIKWRAS